MRLTVEQKQEIRDLYATGNVTQCELAERFGVAQTTISKIIIRPLLCADCSVPLVGKRRCESCQKRHAEVVRKQWKDAHREQLNQRQAMRWQTNEQHRERHRVDARESYRRLHVPKRKRGIA